MTTAITSATDSEYVYALRDFYSISSPSTKKVQYCATGDKLKVIHKGLAFEGFVYIVEKTTGETFSIHSREISEQPITIIKQIIPEVKPAPVHVRPVFDELPPQRKQVAKAIKEQHAPAQEQAKPKQAKQVKQTKPKPPQQGTLF